MAGFMDANGDADDEAISVINIIPFVDIALVLLIIFMLTSAAIVKASFKVDLPKAANAGQSVESTINLVVTKERQLYLNGQLTSLPEVAAFVQVAAQVNPDVRAVIAADKIAEYGNVIEVIDLIKENGVKAFALNIQRDVKPHAVP
jgi:biopolymer transport protein ExbD